MNDSTTHDSNNTIKYCECGCGQPAPIAKTTNKKFGHIAGQPVRFIYGHHARLQKPRPVLERFWENVDKRGPNECWEWTAGKNGGGYGQMTIGSRRDGTKRTVKTASFSYELHHGPIPDGMSVCHHCDNRPCVNPAHLFLGTTQENTQDMVDKGRQARGARHGSAKLTPEDVQHIRTLRKNGMTLKDIAAQFGVHLATIHQIAKGKTWRHIE